MIPSTAALAVALPPSRLPFAPWRTVAGVCVRRSPIPVLVGDVERTISSCLVATRAMARPPRPALPTFLAEVEVELTIALETALPAVALFAGTPYPGAYFEPAFEDRARCGARAVEAAVRRELARSVAVTRVAGSLRDAIDAACLRRRFDAVFLADGVGPGCPSLARWCVRGRDLTVILAAAAGPSAVAITPGDRSRFATLP